jgi:MFS family permease
VNVRAGRVVLLLVVVLHLVADTALSPFYPQLFKALFGITDPAATGGYVWACRVAAVVALPLWGLAARRWPLHRLVVAGLLLSAAIDAVLGFAPTYATFLALSVALVATTMSMALAYPAFMALSDAESRPQQVMMFTGVSYAAVVVSTLAGAAVMALPDIRWGISSFALLDLALAYACHRVLARPVPVAESSVPRTEDTIDRFALVKAVAGVGGIVFVAELGRSVVRPFYTAYAESGGEATFGAALLFLLPSLVALLVLPAAGLVQRRIGETLLPATFAVGALGLAVQAVAPRLPLLLIGAVLFGAALGLGQIALDLRMFGAVGTRGPAFTTIETVRTVALMVSPLAATAAVGPSLAGPLILGAVLLAALGIALALPHRRQPARPTIPSVTPVEEGKSVVGIG